jgi:hypothetical protein
MFVFLITSFYCFAQKIETVNIESKIYGGQEIMIYTPRLYEEYPHKKYEVVYVFDSQARQYFDYVHSSLTFLNSAVPMIVVGVISKERDDDFLLELSDFLDLRESEELDESDLFNSISEDSDSILRADVLVGFAIILK